MQYIATEKKRIEEKIKKNKNFKIFHKIEMYKRI